MFPTVMALAIFITISVPAHCLQCRFKLAPYTYDLCPLLFTFNSSLTSSSRRIHIHKDTLTPPTLTRNAYDIDLGGEGLKKNTSLPETEQCPDGTWICLKISNTLLSHPSEPRRILQIIPVSGNIKEYSMIHGTPGPNGVNATARLVSPRGGSRQVIPLVEVTLNGGWYLSRPQRAVISLSCDESITEPSEPIPDLFKQDLSSSDPLLPLDEMFYSPQTDTHGFTWKTKYACPIAQDEKPPDPSRTAEPPSEPSRKSEEQRGGEDNVTPEVPLSDSNGRIPVNMVKIAGICIGTLVTLALLWHGIYLSQLQRRKQRYPSLSRRGASHANFSSLGLTVPPFASLPFTVLSFVRPFRRSLRRTYFAFRFGTNYDPLVAEEYEIQDDVGDGVIVDFQRQGLLQGSKTNSASHNGYGSVR